MKRLYFLLPDTETCRNLVDDLERHGVEHRHLHVIADEAQSL